MLGKLCPGVCDDTSTAYAAKWQSLKLVEENLWVVPVNSQKKDRYYNFLVHFRFHQVGLMWWYGLVVWGSGKLWFFVFVCWGSGKLWFFVCKAPDGCLQTDLWPFFHPLLSKRRSAGVGRTWSLYRNTRWPTNVCPPSRLKGGQRVLYIVLVQKHPLTHQCFPPSLLSKR